MRAAAASEVYIATSDAFLDVPNDADERACAKAVDAMGAHHPRDQERGRGVRRQGARRRGGGGREDRRRGGCRGRRRGTPPTPTPAGSRRRRRRLKRRRAREDAGEAAPGGRRPAASAEGEPEGERPAGERPAGERARGRRRASSRACAEDRVSAVEQDVSGLKEGMKNIMSTLFNIQEQLKANPGAGAGAAADGAVAAAKTGGGVDPGLRCAHHRGRQSCARGGGRGEVLLGRQEEGEREGEREKNGEEAEARRVGGRRRGGGRRPPEDSAKAPPIEMPEEKKADEALKAPVAEGDLESYEAQMMGPGNAQ